MRRRLIDGYNVLFAILKDDSVMFDATRAEFIRQVRELARRQKLPTVLLFDGTRGRCAAPREESDAWLQVRFTGMKTADAVIQSLVEEDKEPRLLSVVTSDREILRHCKANHVATRKSADFLEELRDALGDPPAEPRQEPEEKRSGAPREGTDFWLRYFEQGRRRPS